MFYPTLDEHGLLISDAEQRSFILSIYYYELKKKLNQAREAETNEVTYERQEYMHTIRN